MKSVDDYSKSTRKFVIFLFVLFSAGDKTINMADDSQNIEVILEGSSPTSNAQSAQLIFDIDFVYQ